MNCVTYEIVDMASGNVVAHYDSLAEAKMSATDYVARHPEYLDEIAIVPLDDDGLAAGESIPASELYPTSATER